MRPLIDQLRNKIGSGIVVVGGVREDKASVFAGVTKDLADVFPAGELVGYLAARLGGRGGGKADMGQGGGPDVGQLDESLASVSDWIAARQ